MEPKFKKSLDGIVEFYFLFRMRPTRNFSVQNCRTRSIFTVCFLQENETRENRETMSSLYTFFRYEPPEKPL